MRLSHEQQKVSWRSGLNFQTVYFNIERNNYNFQRYSLQMNIINKIYYSDIISDCSKDGFNRTPNMKMMKY